MANILIGVTGSVAAIRTPELFAALRTRGHAVKIVATHAATYFFDPSVLEPLVGSPDRRNPEIVILDEDEWPGHGEGRRYQRDDEVLHITLRRWAELLLVAPLDANTLAKFAGGLADNCLTCIWRAWDRAKPVVLAPAMNTMMWEHAITRRHLRQLALDANVTFPANECTEEELIAALNQRDASIRIVPPQTKRLACGDIGNGAMATIENILVMVEQALLKFPRAG